METILGKNNKNGILTLNKRHTLLFLTNKNDTDYRYEDNKQYHPVRGNQQNH